MFALTYLDSFVLQTYINILIHIQSHTTKCIFFFLDVIKKLFQELNRHCIKHLKNSESN